MAKETAEQKLLKLIQSTETQEDTQAKTQDKGAKMTCQDALALLDDFVDGELDSSTAGAMRNHIETCDHCRAEHAATERLKELLNQPSIETPGPDYWSETTHLIMARTVGRSRD